jgi:hypothetical protein
MWSAISLPHRYLFVPNLRITLFPPYERKPASRLNPHPVYKIASVLARRLNYQLLGGRGK